MYFGQRISLVTAGTQCSFYTQPKLAQFRHKLTASVSTKPPSNHLEVLEFALLKRSLHSLKGPSYKLANQLQHLLPLHRTHTSQLNICIYRQLAVFFTWWGLFVSYFLDWWSISNPDYVWREGFGNGLQTKGLSQVSGSCRLLECSSLETWVGLFLCCSFLTALSPFIQRIYVCIPGSKGSAPAWVSCKYLKLR